MHKRPQRIEGAAAIGGFISASSETLILQDDFEWWRDHQERYHMRKIPIDSMFFDVFISDDSGKLLLLDTDDANILQVNSGVC